MKKQVVVIHGGNSFDSYEKFIDSLRNCEVTLESFLPRTDWKATLTQELGEDFEVLAPRMPNGHNARYEEWKIWFERMIPFIQDDGVALIGHSQGGIFLAKYLSENKFPKKIAGLFLVAAPHIDTREIGDFALGESLSGVVEQCGNIHLFQSQDDPVVPFGEVERYKKEFPAAEMHLFKDREHFNQKDFPEIIKEIKELHPS
jgi:uncharacterized protein